MNRNTTIGDLSAAQELLREEIFKALRKFQTATGLLPRSIEMQTAEHREYGVLGNDRILCGVRVTVELEL